MEGVTFVILVYTAGVLFVIGEAIEAIYRPRIVESDGWFWFFYGTGDIKRRGAIKLFKKYGN